MTGGVAMAVTAVMFTYQWADTHTIARGRPTAAPTSAHVSV